MSASPDVVPSRHRCTTSASESPVLPTGVLRLGGGTVPDPVVLDLPDRVVATAWVAPAAHGAGGPGRLQGVLAGVPTEAPVPGGRGTWTLGLDRGGHPVLRWEPCGDAHLDGARPGDRTDRTLDVVAPSPVPRLGWTHLEARVGPADMELLVDGSTVGRATLPESDGTGGATTVHIGSIADAWVERSIRFGFFTGLLAEVEVRGGTTSAPATRGTRPTAPAADPAEEWRTDQEVFAADRDRPRFHFAPPAQWMNEPHGILHHGGSHHLYYQRNELGPFWGALTWGHAVSDDLVHWTDLGSCLVPADVPWAPEGVWSGCSTTDGDGVPLLFFTAGDDRDDPNQRTGWARPADPTDPDLRDWVPGPGPVTTLHDALPRLRAAGLEPLPGEFRDPFIWQDGDSWFQVVGGGIEGRGGTAYLFRTSSPTDGAWEFCGPLMVGDHAARPETGVAWELPVLLPVGCDGDGRRKHALFVTPWWPTPCEHSLLYEWYWVGEWDASTATWSPDHEEPRLLDLGGFFTGVTGSVTPDGRTLLWTVTQDLLSEDEHIRRGWAQNAGVPMEIRYVDGDLRVAPVRELTALREPAAVRRGADDLSQVRTVAVDAGPMLDLEVVADVPVGGVIQVDLRVDEQGAAAVRLVVERTGEGVGRITVVRQGATEPHRVLRSGEVILPPAQDVRLQVLVDHSMVEAFVQGRRSVTTRAWAGPQERDLGAVAVEGGAQLKRTTVWPMRPAVVQERRGA
ncbi:GH32 C-terminal domain-containing protein [Actinotalea sp. K2]|uniref:glycoside hydrolase family 32 protein n=1 Tax=Actinotalea sp. K2 TaxID=2939438 RepID=UPI00201815B0|nr:GH32 C-terminal domain-containing protein [Actinotalea sp. K2]MCL3861220.1 GH32 C-terminal domain-containing protein [Actinotalea sp. K2]